MNTNEYKTLPELIADKQGSAPPFHPSAAMIRGTLHETNAACLYIERNPDNYYYTTGMVKSYNNKMGTSPDLIVVPKDIGKPFGCVEIKVKLFKCCKTVPPAHMSQMQHNMGVIGCSWTDYVQYRPENPLTLTVMRVPFDASSWRDHEDACVAFYDMYIEPRIQIV